MSVKQAMISCPFSGNYIHRHHVEQRVKLYVPREGSFPISQRYIDVTRAARTILDVMLERPMEDYWKKSEEKPRFIRFVGRGSHDSPYWKRNFQMSFHGPECG